MSLAEQWQLEGNAAEQYERFTVARVMQALGERFVASLDLTGRRHVLDLACGTGTVARLVAPRLPAGGTVTGLDLNENMLAVARKVSARSSPPIGWQRGDGTAIPFETSSFDGVLCQQGLQFMPDKVAVLREIHRVLMPRGMLALNVWGAPSRFHSGLAEGLAKFVGEDVARLSLAPFTMRDPHVLRSLVATAGFEKTSVETMTIARKVEPTQQWLLEHSAGLPFGHSVAAMAPRERAAMVRELAARMEGFWAGDSFSVPCEVHFLHAFR
jgi:ubiquinone/menaquinone biosynthesis C-methylase UbiE